MAPNSAALKFLLVAGIIISVANVANGLLETDMTFYLHDVSEGQNATFFPVAGIPGKLWSSTQFGTVYVHDDPITEGPDPNSAPVARAQGMHVVASSDGTSSLVMMSFVFTNEAYSGSTLQIFGTNRQNEAVREVPVIAGTGKFRSASGYAMFQKYIDFPDAYSVIQCYISIHYNI
ncbi:dirigent protein 1-like [Pistacia vera]|uniref:dirigent protein 1-like n=1 Tax=Pistacia vera TaxID=55513 RepID=UPI001262AEF2|nr:dirigent protein 1-like [Pistacia vera]